MGTPWLTIPLADYEGHMALPGIDQSNFLAGVLSEQLKVYRPESLAVVGCAGGNGFECIDPQTTKRVVGIDVNASYLTVTRGRYDRAFERLDLYALDIETSVPAIAPVDLIYAALLFEYVDPEKAIANITSLCRPGGHLVTVLQLSSFTASPVSPSPFASLHALTPAMRLVEPEVFAAFAAAAGFTRLSSSQARLQSGKDFSIDVFSQPSANYRIERTRER
jgi:SAM-dependent methyltransferase